MQNRLLSVLVTLCLFVDALAQNKDPAPFCTNLLQHIPGPELEHLRASYQELTYQRGRVSNYELFMNNQNPTEEGKKLTYKTTLSVGELQQMITHHQGISNGIEGRINAALQKLKSDGVVSADVNVKLLAACVTARMNPHYYPHKPKVSFLLQYFKRPYIIERFVQSLHSCDNVTTWELIVNVDSPADVLAWTNQSSLTNGQVIPIVSANVHEVRAYNRMMGISKGDIAIIAADDDYFPANCSWLDHALTMFDRFPQTGIIGVRNYVLCYDNVHNSGNWFYDPPTRLAGIFASKVDMAPMAVRRKAYMSIGGFDESTGEPGECGILTDWDICLRMWLAGWQVMQIPPVVMVHEFTPGGTHTTENVERCWGKQAAITGAVMQTRMDASVEKQICQLAKQTNIQNLKLLNESACPYAEDGGCTTT